jgi:hypothetical protein
MTHTEANEPGFAKAKKDKDTVKKKKKPIEKYAIVVYKEPPAILISSILDYNSNVFKVLTFKNLAKRNNFIKLHSKELEGKYPLFAKVDKNKLTYEL